MEGGGWCRGGGGIIEGGRPRFEFTLEKVESVEVSVLPSLLMHALVKFTWLSHAFRKAAIFLEKDCSEKYACQGGDGS